MGQDIASTLKRFNRKERYWVVRNALDIKDNRLSADFRARLEGALAGRGVRLDPAAWWAIDYHIDWLIAALRLHHANVEPNDFVQDNPKQGPDGLRAVRGQQEDIDLVVACGADVILIEAKAFGAWSNGQLKSKLERLNTLGADADGVVAGGGAGEPVRLHFVVLSQDPPGKLDAKLPFPDWAWSAKTRTPYWLGLDIEADRPDLAVSQCDAHGKPVRDGGHWRVWSF